MVSNKNLMSNIPKKVKYVTKSSNKFRDEAKINFCADYEVQKGKQKFTKMKPGDRNHFLEES